MKSITYPPGPKGVFFIGSLIDYFRNMLGFLLGIAREYGDIAFFNIGSRKIYLLSHPDLIQQVLITDNRKFTKSRALKRSKVVVGEGLLTVEGNTHLNRRRLLQPAFHTKSIKTYADTIIDTTAEKVDRWEYNKSIDIHKEMMGLTLAIVTKTLFGTETKSESDEIGECLTTIVKQFPRMLFPYSEYLDNLPIPSIRNFKQSLTKLDEIIHSLIEERRGEENEKNDILSTLIKAQDEESGIGLTNDELRDEAMTLFIAGQETTANALVWTIYLLCTNPAIKLKFQEELDCILNKDLPSFEDLNKLEYTNMVFKEALRLYPPAWNVARHAIDDYKIDEYIVPSGSDIYMSPYVVHHDERFFPEPFKFYPDRWKEEHISSLPRFAYFPFGGGPRRCIGESFAIMEGVLIIAIIFSKYDVELTPGQKIVPNALITIRPKYGMKVNLKKRVS